MKKTILIATVVFMAAVGTTKAQSYRTALGLRLGDPTGITLQHYMSGNSALEGILGFGPYWFTLTGLYEYHKPIASAPGLGWFIGFGAHIGSIGHRYYYDGDKYYDNGFLFGLDGILGLDYTFAQAPINLSLDWKPAIELSPFAGFVPGEFGFSVRYTFGR